MRENHTCCSFSPSEAFACPVSRTSNAEASRRIMYSICTGTIVLLCKAYTIHLASTAASFLTNL